MTKKLNIFFPPFLQIAKILIVVWIALFIITGIYKSFILAAMCGFLLLGVTGIAHNFVHQKPSIYRFYYSFTGLTHK